MWQVILIAFVIPVAVWIIASLYRVVEEQQRTPPRPRMDGSPPAPGSAERPRRPVNDIESFLEEINRRRREGTVKPRPSAPARPASAATPARPRPKPVVRRPSPVTPTATLPETVKRPTPTRPAKAEVVDVVVAEVQPTRAAKPEVVEAIVVAAEVQPSIRTPSAPATRIVRQATPNLVALTNMLRSPQSVRTAILLQEVLSPPLCKRRR